MSADHGEGLPDREQMVKAVEAAQKAQRAQSTAESLKSKAMKMTSSKERERMLQEAYAAEVEAHGQSKLAKRLQSGAWQGGGIGGGIGAGVGVGLGTVVGSLVGGIAAIPTTGLGILVGATTGAIHGPFIKVGGEEKKFEDAEPEEVVNVIEEEQEAQRRADLGQRVAGAGNGQTCQAPKKKPRKLEIRSAAQLQRSSSTEKLERRKPRKIEVRSKAQLNGAPQKFYGEEEI